MASTRHLGGDSPQKKAKPSAMHAGSLSEASLPSRPMRRRPSSPGTPESLHAAQRRRPGHASLQNTSVTPRTHTSNWQRNAIDSFPPAGQVRTRSPDSPTRDSGEPPRHQAVGGAARTLPRQRWLTPPRAPHTLIGIWVWADVMALLIR